MRKTRSAVRPRRESHFNPARLALLECLSVRRCIDRHVGRLAELDHDFQDFSGSQMGPSGPIDTAWRTLQRCITEIETKIGKDGGST